MAIQTNTIPQPAPFHNQHHSTTNTIPSEQLDWFLQGNRPPLVASAVKTQLAAQELHPLPGSSSCLLQQQASCPGALPPRDYLRLDTGSGRGAPSEFFHWYLKTITTRHQHSTRQVPQHSTQRVPTSIPHKECPSTPHNRCHQPAHHLCQYATMPVLQ